MIRTALDFLADELNAYLRAQTADDLGGDGAKGKVTFTTLKEGQDPIPNMGMTLVNVEEERIGKAQGKTYIRANGVQNEVNPEIRLNLFVCFSGNFGTTGYADSLDFISHVTGFFQSNMVLDHQSHPALDTNIERLVPELYSIPLEQLSYMWGALGANYVPSVLYKVRLIAIQANIVKSPSSIVTSVESTTQSV